MNYISLSLICFLPGMGEAGSGERLMRVLLEFKGRAIPLMFYTSSDFSLGNVDIHFTYIPICTDASKW
jgi:hypothetical protein